MRSPILGQSYVARSVNAAANRMVNLFPEVVPEGGKEAAYLQRCPGLKQVAEIGAGPIRGLWTFGGYGYVASGDQLYRINTSFVPTLLGTITGSGPVSMADNGTQLFVACNGASYIYNASTGVFSLITDPDFPGAVTVGYIDGYFVFNEPNSQRIWVTALLDGTDVDALAFASAEGNPDNVVGLVVDHREVWVYGTSTVEVWYDSGNTDFPLERIQGAFNEVGLASPYTIAKLDNGLFWLAADARGQGMVYRANGYTGQRISTHAVEWQIQSYGNLSDAIAYTYQQDGHSFYVLTFPSANATWVYDVATNSWHERASLIDNVLGRHRSNCQMQFANKTIVGDFENGALYELDPNTFDDNGAAQKWLRSWRALPTGQNNLTRTAHHSLQLDCETGVGLISSFDETEPPTDANAILLAANGAAVVTNSGAFVRVGTQIVPAAPKVMLRWSDDGGHTWSNEHWREMGRIGEYGYRTIWRRLGMTTKLRDRVYECSGSDPVKIALMGAELLLSPTNA